MTDEERSKQASEQTAKQAQPIKSAPAYEPPRLTLVGNLNDLLAGSGSKDTDNPPTCAVNATVDLGGACN